MSVAKGTSAVSLKPASIAAEDANNRKLVVGEMNCAAADALKIFPEPSVTVPVSVELLKRLYCAVVVAPDADPMVSPGEYPIQMLLVVEVITLELP